MIWDLRFTIQNGSNIRWHGEKESPRHLASLLKTSLTTGASVNNKMKIFVQ